MSKNLQLPDEILTKLVNSFYTRRFALVGHVIHILMRDGEECSDIPRTISGMTVFGYFMATYPQLIKTMESVEEHDFEKRLKVLALVKKHTPNRVKKRKSKEQYEITKQKRDYANHNEFMQMLVNREKSTMLAIV